MRLSLSVRIYRRLRIVFKGLKNSKREREGGARIFDDLYFFGGWRRGSGISTREGKSMKFYNDAL